MDEYLWIEQGRALQVDLPQNITPHSSLSIIQSARVEDIVEEYLGILANQVGLWNQLYDEGNDVENLVIHRTQEGNWDTFQPYYSNHSFRLFYPEHEGEPLTNSKFK